MPFFKKRLTPCACPPPTPPPLPSLSLSLSSKSSYEGSVHLNIKPGYRSPIDNLGYPDRCCWCIPLRIGVSIICFMSFMWALVELTRSEKTILAIFPEKKNNSYKIAKLLHLAAITIFLLSCGVLLLGIITNKFKAINLYVWVALIFTCISLVVIMVSLACQVANTGMTKRSAMIMTLSVAWYSSCFYYICVVNSYKYRVFGTDLLQNV